VSISDGVENLSSKKSFYNEILREFSHGLPSPASTDGLAIEKIIFIVLLTGSTPHIEFLNNNSSYLHVVQMAYNVICFWYV